MRPFRFPILALTLSGLLLSSCDPRPKADFIIALDPDMPGKVNLTNTTENGNYYSWELWLAGGEFTDDLSMSSSYWRTTSDETDTYFYIQTNTWIEVKLTAFGGLGESVATKRIEVTNIPSKVTIGDLVVTRVIPTAPNGSDWDELNGTPGYQLVEEFPDLLVNNTMWSSYTGTNVVWNVDILNGLPITLSTDNSVYTPLSPQTDKCIIELVDFDGNPGSMFVGPGQRIGRVEFNPYHLTHVYNKGEATNYPSVYRIETEGFDADLHMVWE